jgi:hypothetical protein
LILHTGEKDGYPTGEKALPLFLKALIIGVLLHLGIDFTVMDPPASTPQAVNHPATMAEPPAR